MFDSSVLTHLFDHVLKKEPSTDNSEAKETTFLPEPTELTWDISADDTNEIQGLIKTAGEQAIKENRMVESVI